MYSKLVADDYKLIQFQQKPRSFRSLHAALILALMPSIVNLQWSRTVNKCTGGLHKQAAAVMPMKPSIRDVLDGMV